MKKINVKETINNATINTEKLQERYTGCMITFSALAIASIAKHGFKGHMKRAWTQNVGKQYALGLGIAVALIASCVEIDK